MVCLLKNLDLLLNTKLYGDGEMNTALDGYIKVIAMCISEMRDAKLRLTMMKDSQDDYLAGVGQDEDEKFYFIPQSNEIINEKNLGYLNYNNNTEILEIIHDRLMLDIEFRRKQNERESVRRRFERND